MTVAGLQCRRGVPLAGRAALSDTFVAHLNEVVDLDELAADIDGRPARHPPLAQHVVGHPRFFAGVLMYEAGPNAGEPATADADEYLRQFYAAKHRHHEVGEALRVLRARLEPRGEDLLIATGS